jgi:hypothetical protein
MVVIKGFYQAVRIEAERLGSSTQAAEQPEKHDRADEGCDQRAKQASGVDSQQSKQEPAQQGANYSDDQVAEQAKAAAAHHSSSQPTGRQADDQEPKYIHGKAPFD